MDNLARRVLVTVLLLVLAGSVTEQGSAREAAVGDGESGGGGGGGGGGRWYSLGSVTEIRYCQTYEQSIVFWPPPPHYEVRLVTVAKEVYFLLEACFPDNAVRECTPGTQRRTYQGG